MGHHLNPLRTLITSAAILAAICTAGAAQAAYVPSTLTTVRCDGATDDAPAINAAVAAGLKFTLPAGVCITGSTLSLTTTASNGLSFGGQGAPDPAALMTTGRTIIRPKAGVSPVFKIDGSGFGGGNGYVIGTRFEAFGVDLSLDPSAPVFAQGQSYDISYDRVRVYNAAVGECSWQFDDGAYVTQIGNSAGMYACWAGDNLDNPTTQTFTNTDIIDVAGLNAGSISFHGGSIQPIYSSGMTVVYSPPGDPQRPTAIAFSTGVYLIVTNPLTNMDSVTFTGTFIGQNGGYPSTWTTTANGTLNAYPVFEVPASVTRATFNPASMSGMYLYDASGSTNAFQINVGGGAAGNVIDAQAAFKGGVSVVNGTTIAAYSDNGITKTASMNGATGAVAGTTVTAQPLSDGVTLTVKTAGGSVAFQCNTAGVPSCGMLNGAGFYTYSDNGTTQTASVNGATGAIKGTSIAARPVTDGMASSVTTAAGANVWQCYTNGTPSCSIMNGDGLYGFADGGGSTHLWSLTNFATIGGYLQLFNSSGAAQLYLYGNGGITGNGNISMAGYYSGATAGVTCSGSPSSSFAVSKGIVTHC